MFDFLKNKKTAITELFEGFVDMHAHLLPGVDDGMKTKEETLEAIRYYEVLGAKKIVFTPHIMEDLPWNTATHLTRRFEEISHLYKGEIELTLGAEYMVDGGFRLLLDKAELLTVTKKTVLVETSYMNPPLGFNKTLYEIQRKGYHVILAHPERYDYMGVKEYELLKNQNIRLQLNLLSLKGVYGKNCQMKAMNLLNKDWYDCVGTDMHDLSFHQKELKHLKLNTNELNHFRRLLSKNNIQ